ncbi:MAG TPA: holo-ACP synthase [Thermoanaerobaculia bacterium]|nr:holo-ACP synthase [Thermoanaerobaculia bacterium]
MSDAVSAADGLPEGPGVAGLGIDVCEIPRVAAALERHGRRFVERLFRPGEIRRPESSPAYAEHVAGLFAAKEAAMKALGTGMRGVAFRELAIVRAPGGPPRLALFGRAAARGRRLGVTGAHVTITHGREIAAAVVLLTGGPSRMAAK